MDDILLPKLLDVRSLLQTHSTKKYAVRSLDEIKKIAIHHSLTSTGSAESFARYHVRNNNWPGIGYHFVVEKDGRIKWCHNLKTKSYHVGNSNRLAIGICLTGDFRDHEPTVIQMQSLLKLCKHLIRSFNLTKEDVLGHSEFPEYSWKECPCISMSILRKALASTKQDPINDMDESASLPINYHSSIRIEFNNILAEMKRKKYRVFTKDHRPYNLNIVGLRSSSTAPNRFDDVIACFYLFQGQWHVYSYKATTDPGLFYLEHPINVHGTAILLPGQYTGSHILGLHLQSYQALKQVGPMLVARDANRDKKLDIENSKVQKGIFGINIHRASSYQESINVNKWSAGCQVIADPEDYRQFMDLCRKASSEWGNTFSYSLLEGLI